jgi:putative FmdB family regulatory protein
MPLYEYRCGGCGNRFEVLQRLGEEADGLACPRCGASRLEKQYSTFASASAGGAAQSGPSVSGCCAGSV